MPRYINPYTDFGFKKLFGEEASKDLLKDFLNQLLPEKHQIDVLNFHNVENLPEMEEARKAFFDIHCISKTGERFIVEMQKAKVRHFKDRALFYTTFPIRDQYKLGKWDFKLEPIYFIGVLDFFYEEEAHAKFYRKVQLKDQDNEDFSDTLNLIFLQMPAFNKQEHELKTKFDKWAYFLKNLETFEAIPQILNEYIFGKAFTIAEMANYSPVEQLEYERSRMGYIGVREAVSLALEEGWTQGLQKGLEEGIEQGIQKGLQKGIEQGIEQGRKEQARLLAREMKAKGLEASLIADITGLTKTEIQQL
jgi:predicted transposase/invertase (TIGR01784 family)